MYIKKHKKIMYKIMYQKNITINVEVSMVTAWKIFPKSVIVLCIHEKHT